MYIQSWSKILTPLHFCQIMHHFSQKKLAITNVLVFTCSYLFCLHWKNTKNLRKKSQIWYHSTQNSKNGLHKTVGTLKLIFGSTPFGKNNRDQSLPVTINEFLSPLYWNFGPLFFFFSICSRCLRFEGCLLPTVVLRSPHRCSMGFRSGLIAGHFRTLQHFVLNHFCVLCALHCAPKFFGNLQISWCRAHSQGIRCQKQQRTSTSWWTSTMFDRRDRVLFFEGLILFSVNSTIMCFTKKLYCPHDVLPEGFWLPQVRFGRF